MQVVSTVKEVRDIVAEWRKEGKTVGFVPTMGYLHEGHGSLISKAVEQKTKQLSVFLSIRCVRTDRGSGELSERSGKRQQIL